MENVRKQVDAEKHTKTSSAGGNRELVSNYEESDCQPQISLTNALYFREKTFIFVVVVGNAFSWLM